MSLRIQHLETLSKPQMPGGEDVAFPPGALDGVTIMRYAHLYRNRVCGGVEQYLRQLDRGLLQRHRMTILQTHLIKDARDDIIQTESIGVGRIVWVPVLIRETDSRLADLPKRVADVYRRSLEASQQEGEGHPGAVVAFMQNLLRYRGGHLRYKIAILSERLPRLLAEQKVDLLALHWMTYDTAPLISDAIKAGVPFVLINHFDNLRLSLPQTRKWVSHAAAIGAVSGQGIPSDLRSKCVNLSDAVDTEFFTPEKAQPVQLPAIPIVLLPARIQAGKGHQDLMEVVRILLARKVDFVLYLAGAVDSEPLHQELRRSATAIGMEKRIVFVGERNAEEIRDWYATSSIVVLPSYSEGLPRVLLEAQAMKKPVVAYDAGGTSEALLSNETGLLVKTGSVSALADKIRFLLENEAERLRMGESGREFVCRQFSVAALVRRHEAFYLRALSGAPRNVLAHSTQANITI